MLSVCFASSCTAGSPNLIEWTLDQVGNRLTETRSTGTVTSTYNAADQLTAAGAKSFTYDDNGNQLTAGSDTMTWDLTDHLKTIAQGGTTTTYTYDGDMVRLQASTGAGNADKTNYLWDINHPNPQIALERDGASSLLRQYIYGLQRIRQTEGTPSYYHYNHLGSVVNLTSATGTTQATYSYEPWGPVRTTSGTPPTNLLGFAGEYQDPTGLYHLRARQYDGTTGRFASQDPASQGLASPAVALWAYSENRPTWGTDPSGLRIAPPKNPHQGAVGTYAGPERNFGWVFTSDPYDRYNAIIAESLAVCNRQPGDPVRANPGRVSYCQALYNESLLAGRTLRSQSEGYLCDRNRSLASDPSRCSRGWVERTGDALADAGDVVRDNWKAISVGTVIVAGGVVCVVSTAGACAPLAGQGLVAFLGSRAAAGAIGCVAAGGAAALDRARTVGSVAAGCGLGLAGAVLVPINGRLAASLVNTSVAAVAGTVAADFLTDSPITFCRTTTSLVLGTVGGAKAWAVVRTNPGSSVAEVAAALTAVLPQVLVEPLFHDC